jgi:hypothetical protein
MSQVHSTSRLWIFMLQEPQRDRFANFPKVTEISRGSDSDLAMINIDDLQDPICSCPMRTLVG